MEDRQTRSSRSSRLSGAGLQLRTSCWSVAVWISLAGAAAPAMLAGESVARAGPPPHAGPPSSRGRNSARSQAAPESVRPRDEPPTRSGEDPAPGMGGGGKGGGGMGGGGMGGGGMGGGGKGGGGKGPDHEAHHVDGGDDSEEFLPGTNLPRLLSGQSLSAQTRTMLQARADDGISQGRSQIVDGLRDLADAGAGDQEGLAAAIARMQQGTRDLSKGLALRSALADPDVAEETALQWIRDDLRLRPSTRRAPSGGLSLFHAGIMAILIAFAAVMLWMYFFKMRRAAALLHTLEKAAPAPGRRVTEQPRRSASWRGELKVAAVFEETQSVKTFRLCDGEGGILPFTYLPGQFLTLKVAPDGKSVQRSYTIASSPTQRDYVEVTVKRENEGLVSRFLHDRVRVGDSVAVSAPAGRFTFTGKEADAIVLIAGGVGITPMMSVVRYLTDRAWRGPVDMLVACQREADVIFAQELAAIARRHDNFRFTVVLSKPADDWTGHKGYLTKETLLDVVPKLGERRVHMCGPPGMMAAVTAALVEVGVPEAQIFTEKFGPARRPESAAPAVSAPTSTKPADAKHLPVVSFRASGKKGTLGYGVTVLDAADSAGIEIDSSCRVGTCGTCMVRLIDGEVTMAVEDGLHPDDKADGFILACQACAKTDVVVDA